MNKKHIGLMLALCLIPLIALGAIAVFQIPVSGLLWGVLVALCPLSHLAMLWFMRHPDEPAPAQTPPHHDHPVAH